MYRQIIIIEDEAIITESMYIGVNYDTRSIIYFIFYRKMLMQTWKRDGLNFLSLPLFFVATLHILEMHSLLLNGICFASFPSLKKLHLHC